MVFYTTGAGAAAADPDDVRCGVSRASMKSNVLLTKSDLGKSKKLHCSADLGETHTYGVAKARDDEGAKEVSMFWKEHQPNPDSQPGPDFKAMNKKAATTGLITAKEQRPFRQGHLIKLKTGAAEVLAPRPPLPSDEDKDFKYGRPSANRPEEEVRLTGEKPPTKPLLQGAYVEDWIAMNESRSDVFEMHAKRIPPYATAATQGHASKADAMKMAMEPKSEFKMKKFEKVGPKVIGVHGYNA